jgi:predicted unusual protein kinase regulating ubiquinone biosynthesis (AarF/ABC1/UbiB family)
VFDRVVEYFHGRFREQIRVEGFSLKEIKLAPDQKLSTSLLDLRELNVSLSDLRDAFHIPREWVLLERTLLLLLGVCTTLDPGMNPASVIQPYVEKKVGAVAASVKRAWNKTVRTWEAGKVLFKSAFRRPFRPEKMHLPGYGLAD